MKIHEQARELGVALANTDTYKRMLAARVGVACDNALKTLMQEFDLKQRLLVEMFQKGDYDNQLVMEITKDIERLQTQMNENPVYAEMLIAEKEFSELLSTVSSEISACIGGTGADEEGCGGNCTSCSGCASHIH